MNELILDEGIDGQMYRFMMDGWIDRGINKCMMNRYMDGQTNCRMEVQVVRLMTAYVGGQTAKQRDTWMEMIVRLC